MLEKQILSLVQDIFVLCQRKNLKIRTIESCTGGALSYYFTYFPGSSQFFDSGIVSYSNDSKIRLASIDARIIESYGPVSFEMVLKMAEGVSKPGYISLATTGILGPYTDDHQAPIGTVYLSVSLGDVCYSKRFKFIGERHIIQMQAAYEAMSAVLYCVSK